MPVRYETATNGAQLRGVVIEIDEKTGKAINIERLDVRS
jgi:calcineurin-like phosphoesterase